MLQWNSLVGWIKQKPSKIGIKLSRKRSLYIGCKVLAISLSPSKSSRSTWKHICARNPQKTIVISAIKLLSWQHRFHCWKSLVQLTKVSCKSCFWTELICSPVHYLVVEEENFFFSVTIQFQGGHKSVW